MDKLEGKIKPIKIDHHRNGVSGEPFDIILFKYTDEGINKKMVGILFPKEDHIAILDVDLLSNNIIEMGKNSWRGDLFEKPLRKVIKTFETIKKLSLDPIVKEI